MSENSLVEYVCPPSNGVDAPLDDAPTIPTTSFSSSEADEIEKNMRYFKTLENHRFKLHGLQLIIWCLIGYFLIVVLDSLLLNFFNWQTSTLVTSFVELLKFLVSTLIGFVFSENMKNKNE